MTSWSQPGPVVKWSSRRPVKPEVAGSNPVGTARAQARSDAAQAATNRSTQVLLNTAFNMFPDSSAAQGKKDGEQKPLTAEQIAFAQITQGIHW